MVNDAQARGRDYVEPTTIPNDVAANQILVHDSAPTETGPPPHYAKPPTGRSCFTARVARAVVIDEQAIGVAVRLREDRMQIFTPHELVIGIKPDKPRRVRLC